MPFIHTRTNISLSRKQKETVKKDLGEAISLIPGKSEQWLMVGFEDSCPLYFAGDTFLKNAVLWSGNDHFETYLNFENTSSLLPALEHYS